MRPDVKFGLVFSMVVVSVAGGYYLYRDSREVPIPVEPGTKKLAEAIKPQAQPAANRQSSASEPKVNRPIQRRPSQKAAGGAKRVGNQQLAGKQPQEPRGSAYPDGKQPVTPSGNATKPVQSTTKLANDGSNPAVTPSPKTSVPVSPSATPGERLAAADPVAKKPAPSETARRSVPLVGTKSTPRTEKSAPPSGRDDVAVDTHRVQSGDTLSSLASLYYGSERYTQFLIDSNKQLADPNRLKIGETVRIPSRPAETVSRRVEGTTPASKAKPEPAAQTYRVQPGDSFYRIAEQSLGDASRWKELFELNRDRVGGDPTKLRVGQEIMLPDK